MLGCPETPSQPNMAPRPMSLGSNTEIAVKHDTTRSKRKKPSSDPELEPEYPDDEQSPPAFSSSSGTPAMVIPAARASSVNRQLQRRRQRRQHGNEDFMAKALEGVTHETRRGNGGTASSSAGQRAPAPAQSYQGAPAVSPDAVPNATCFLCRGPAFAGRQVDLLAPGHGGWVPDHPGDFIPGIPDNPSYSLQPAMQPTAWQQAATGLAQFHVPRFPAGWPGSDQVDAAVAWPMPIDAYKGSDRSSYSAGFPGFPEHAAPFPMVPGALDSHAQGMGGYDRHPVAEEAVSVPWSFEGGLAGGGDDAFGPIPSCVTSEWPAMPRASGD
ncbi:hypothetical protein IMZ48_10570 [Candidatus Bathyarchaeota archaeon]|nr:hypothetical protein [Candidatus Bathyarchaeota archaeon]